MTLVRPVSEAMLVTSGGLLVVGEDMGAATGRSGQLPVFSFQPEQAKSET